MRNNLCLVALGALGAIALVSALGAQETQKPVTAPPTTALLPDASLIWNYYYSGKKKRGDVIELERLDDPAHGGKALVITHIEIRMPQSTRMELQEYRQDPQKKQRDGSPGWTKAVRRGEALTSTGFIDSTSQWVLAGYGSLVGCVFDPGTRPSLEVTFGGGDVEIWAEGYWATPRKK
ncbi:MAG TPA: hypothetical protein VFY93_04170 [Planctomycetota bacterium]|nr:hypothetical protein [Planctomycetota bacterium]